MPADPAFAAFIASDPDTSACDRCDADAEIVKVAPRVHLLAIRHDDGCPVLARYEGLRA